MAASKEPLPWKPIPGNDFLCNIGRALSWWAYPSVVPLIWCYADASPESARWFRSFYATVGLGGSILVHSLIARRFGGSQDHLRSHIIGQVVSFLMWDMPMFSFVAISNLIEKVFAVNRSESRLNAGRLRGSRVCIMGNGPSAIEGEAMGEDIDKFDEVIRFNNFQTKVAGLEKMVGTKCTVHFSDGVLYPTYTEYFVEGADVVLSLFMDRYPVCGTYVILRGCADFRWGLTSRFLMHPNTTWISKDNIERVKKAAGIAGFKHPTSGMLAIDLFMNMPGVQLPVYIHGFDFFQGPTIHYYHKQEPLYERINNRIGVNMHSPHLEKLYVEKLIQEGKVCFLKDMPRPR